MKQALSALLVFLSLAGIGFGGMQLAGYYREEAQSDSLDAELTALYHAEIAQTDQTAKDELLAPVETAPTAQIKVEITTGINLPASTVEPPSSGLLALNAENPDCVAWITIEGTMIDYPVMYRPADKDYYLHRDFYGKSSSRGSLYIAEGCSPDGDNLIIYGHHMNSGTMFAALNKYKQRSFYEEHRYIRLETPAGVLRYEIMYALTTPVYTGHDFAYYNFTDAATAEDFDAYIAGCAARALYETGVTAQYGDRLLTLSTCEYSQKNGRMLVVAKRINE